MSGDTRQLWRPITAVPTVNGSITPLLSTVDSLRSAWKEALDSSTPEEREAARARRLRRHAVETGIIERLYELDWGITEESGAAHPLVRGAWLHHRFIQIHPFEDGNGRVARALTLLVLLRDHYAPLVVDPRRQVIAAANSVDFYSNLSGGTWWACLQLDAMGERLRYLATVQKVGRGETGVLASTAYAEFARPESDETSVAVEPQPALDLSPTDSVTLAYTDTFTDRYPEVEDFLRATLRRSVERFVARLG